MKFLQEPTKLAESADDAFYATGDHEEEEDSLWVLVMNRLTNDPSHHDYYADYHGVNVLFNKDGKVDAATGDPKADREWDNHQAAITKVAKDWAMKHYADKMHELGYK